jgi:4'-phosphopantetheinyl transferase EntD
MLEELVPTCVICVESFEDRDVVLFPQEAAVIADAVPKRRYEFTTARWCARNALGKLGLSAVPILPGLRGEPVWPSHTVGSITHTHGYRAAAVARSSQILTLGIDAEPNEPLPVGVFESISLPEERQHLGKLGDAAGVSWDRLLFSMKESVYKAWYPITHRWLDFAEATVRVDPDRGTFTAGLLGGPVRVAGARIAAFDGRWVAREGLLVTAVSVTRHTARAHPVGIRGRARRPTADIDTG